MDTTVSYHRDYAGPGRPAVNVKVHGFDRQAFDKLADDLGNETKAENYWEDAWEFVAERFWDDAQGVAYSLGLGDIEQEGQSGGWLVLADGRDPDEMVGLERYNWLRKYRKLVDWADTQVRQAPAEIAYVAREFAEDELTERERAVRKGAFAAAGVGL